MHICIPFVLRRIGRGYEFDVSKIHRIKTPESLLVTTGQLEFEFFHLLEKLFQRDKEQWNLVQNVHPIQSHPIFKVIPDQ